MTKLELLSKILIDKLRDENFEYYIHQRDYAKSMTKEEYYKIERNPNIDDELQRSDDKRFDFLNGLNEKQLEQLDNLILSILDSTAFNLLREVEEHLMTEKSLGLTINGEKVDSLSRQLLSGTFFGEYFIWCEKNSKFGKYKY